jgi:hypothetical protein
MNRTIRLGLETVSSLPRAKGPRAAEGAPSPASQRNGPGAEMRGNNRTSAHSLGLSFSLAQSWPRANRELFPAPQPAQTKSTVRFWMGVGFGVALSLATMVLAISGTDPNSLRLALRVTARWSFLLFWLAYAGSAMGALFGPALAPLAWRGREFGLAYASAQLVHVGLVIRLFQITSRVPLSGKPLVLFTIAIIWTYLLAVFSVGGFSKVLGSKGWYTLRTVGMNFILFAFAADFVHVAISRNAYYGFGVFLAYAPFAAMSVAAPMLVLAEAALRRMGIRYNRAGLVPVK